WMKSSREYPSYGLSTTTTQTRQTSRARDNRPMPRSITRVAPMRRILTVAEPEVMVQLVRLIVLYEDLKLEVAGLHVPPDKEFDEVSKHYRSMYFIRRAFATLWE